MANQKITQLSSYSNPINTDVLPIVDVTSGTTKKITIPSVAYSPATLVVAPSSSNVKADYYTTGTNDDVQIQAAITAIASSGGRILLHAGTYTLGAQLVISSSNIVLEGQGNATILKQKNSGNLSSLLYVNGTGSPINSIWLRDFLVDGNKANNSFADGILFQTPASENSWVIVENVTVQNCQNNGFRWNTSGGSNSSSSYYLKNLWSKNNNGNGFFASQNSGASSLTDAVVDSCISETNALNGFYLAALDTHFTNCKAYFNGSAGGSNHGFYLVGYNNYFDGCEAQDNYGCGFFLNNDGDGTYGTQNNVFTGCDADSNYNPSNSRSATTSNSPTGYGWYINNTTGTQLMNCQSYVRPYAFAWGQNIGVGLLGTTTNTYIVGLRGTGNTSSLYSDTSSGTNYPLHVSGVGSTLQTKLVVNNQIRASGGFMQSDPVTLTDAATIATDASQSNTFYVTLGGSRTLGNPTNMADGQIVTWRIRQDGSGSRGLTLGSAFRFGTTITSYTPSTGINKNDYLTAKYNATDSKWDVLDVKIGF